MSFWCMSPFFMSLFFFKLHMPWNLECKAEFADRKNWKSNEQKCRRDSTCAGIRSESCKTLQFLKLNFKTNVNKDIFYQ